MADYPLKQEAAEVQEIISGAVLSSKPTTLTESEKAQARDNIGASAFGSGIKLISHFDTLDELKAAVPSPSAGDAYSVGLTLPYSLYAYDFYNGEWKNYGAIRANDIAARVAQNKAVLQNAWVKDSTVFEDYTYKAAITLGEITGNDFPIVGFNPPDATSGNYAPIAYAFDGYVEIWAKEIPAGDIIVPSITFIVLDTESGATGNNTKGITNASGGLATGSIDASKLSDGAVTVPKVAAEARTQYFDVTVGTGWIGDAAPYSQTIAVDGLLESDRAVVRFSAPDNFDDLDAHQEAFALLYTAESADGAITLYAKDLPETAFNVVLEVARI